MAITTAEATHSSDQTSPTIASGSGQPARRGEREIMAITTGTAASTLTRAVCAAVDGTRTARARPMLVRIRTRAFVVLAGHRRREPRGPAG